MKKIDMALGIGLLVYLLIFWKRLLLFGSAPFDGDTLAYFYPVWVTGKNLLMDGGFLLWDPYRNMGQPFLASPQEQALYPFRFFCLFLNYVEYQRLFVVFHTLLSVGFAYALGLSWFKKRGPAVLMALGFGFNGFLFWRILYPTNFASLCWVPAVLYFFHIRRTLPLALCLFLQWLAGYPPFSILTGVLLLVACVSSEDIRGSAWMTAKAGVIAFGLAGVQILPFIEMVQQSIRPVLLDAADALQDSVHPHDLWTQLVTPSLLQKGALHGNAGLVSFTLSPIMLLLGLYAVFTGRRRERVFGGAALVAFLLSMGDAIGFYSRLPLATVFRYPSHWLMVGIVGTILAAAYGISRIKSQKIQVVLLSLLAIDLLGYVFPQRYRWEKLEFIRDTPLLLEGLNPMDPHQRLFHSDFIRLTFHQWSHSRRMDVMLDKAVLLPSYGTSYRLRDTATGHNLVSRRAFQYTQRLDQSPVDSELFDYAGVEKIIRVRPEGEAGDYPLFEDFQVITNPNPKPRAFHRGGGNLRVMKDQPGHIEVEAEGEGLVVVSEAFNSGWKLALDGQPARANPFEEMFLSADIGPGVHRLEFIYRPVSFFVGLFISLLTAMAAFGFRKKL